MSKTTNLKRPDLKISWTKRPAPNLHQNYLPPQNSSLPNDGSKITVWFTNLNFIPHINQHSPNSDPNSYLLRVILKLLTISHQNKASKMRKFQRKQKKRQSPQMAKSFVDCSNEQRRRHLPPKSIFAVKEVWNFGGFLIGRKIWE
jgi:hypothetical protein